MEIKARKNDYNHDVVDCPFCKYFAYVRPISKVSPDPLRDLKRHITNQAKNESLSWALSQETVQDTKPFPHLSYYIEHTNEGVVLPKITKRVYDADLTLK